MQENKPVRYYLYKNPSNGIFYYKWVFSNNTIKHGGSTKQKNRIAANRFCQELLSESQNLKIESKTKNVFFREYATGWWVKGTCRYIENARDGDYELSQVYISHNKNYLDNYLLPYWGDYRLSNITEELIIKWRKNIVSIANKKPLSSSSRKKIYNCLKHMLDYAYKEKAISTNPCATIEVIKEKNKCKGILNTNQFTQLFNTNNIDAIWGNNIWHYTANLLASFTGIRISEVLALQACDILEESIQISHAFTRETSRCNLKFDAKTKRFITPPTKTRDKRIIPLSLDLFQLLKQLAMKNNNVGFIFSHDGGKTPYSDKSLQIALSKALEKIKIDYKNLNITFHSWRHFANTFYLNKTGMNSLLVQQITGHKTNEMTEHYFRQIDNSNNQKVQDAQESLIKNIYMENDFFSKIIEQKSILTEIEQKPIKGKEE